MRHLTIRLQLSWLTVTAFAAFGMMFATRLEGLLDAEFARSVTAFGQSLRPDASMTTLNLARAQLAADMVFLVAYGLLLRQSVRYVGPHPRAALARDLAIVTMVADAVENVGALTVVRALAEQRTELPAWVLTTMNVAAIVKWVAVGLVMLFLATAWRPRAGRLKGPLKWVGRGIVLFFALGGLGSILVAASPVFPRVRGPAAMAALFAPAAALLLQFRLLDVVGLMLRFVYLARVPVIVLITTALFGPLALGSAAPLLGGIIDIPSTWGIVVVTAASIVLASACATEINLVRAYAWQRMFDRTLRVLRHRALGRAVSWTALVSVSSLLFSVGVASLRVATWRIAAGVVLGLCLAVAFLFVVEWIAAFWFRSSGAPGPQLAVPFRRIRALDDWLREAESSTPSAAVSHVTSRVRRWSIAGRLFGLQSGYIEALPDGRRRLLRGHQFAIVQFAVSLVFYAALVYGKTPGSAPSTESDLWVPTAGSVVLLLLLSSWTFAGVAFFLDRYRWPLITAMVGVTLLTGSRPHTDYEVRTSAANDAAYELATPGQVLGAFPSPLVIAAAGGGIQAGAWTARALQGIEQRLGGTLRQRVALVSAVSGGSMGALYFGAFRDAGLAAAAQQALEPSLDEVASALIGADLVRVLGWRLGSDRGEALERSWAMRVPPPARDETLRSWADKAMRFVHRHDGAPPFPAFLFNTTIVETGQPMAFATTQFPTAHYRRSFSAQAKQYPVVESANHIFGLSRGDGSARDVGLAVASAARVSAAFPYVSPAATLDLDTDRRFHLVDGGYYDNYGLVAMAQWLDDALEEIAQRPAQIGVIVIRGLAESGSQLREGEEHNRMQSPSTVVPRRGWAWQIVAPPSAFVRTRTFGQWAGGVQILKLLAEKWKERGVEIRPYLFDFPVNDLPPACQVAPLSWKLNATQRACIDAGWQLRETEGSELWSSPATDAR